MPQYASFLISFLAGIIPALFWLWFWLKEDKQHPEPKQRIGLSFLAGMLAVVLVLPIERFLYKTIGPIVDLPLLLSWATAEEFMKFLAAYLSSFFKNKANDEPIDSVIYFISAALGFSALENTFFISNLIDQGLFAKGLISGNMRFLGATLLHTVSSAIIGIFLAFGFYKKTDIKNKLLLTGLTSAIILHTIFNYLIIEGEENSFLVFGGVWIAIIVLILIFEKIKTIKK